jgi:TonB family protein
MRSALLAVLLLSPLASAENLPLPAWATPGTESRSVREALEALHSAEVSFDGQGDTAIASVWEGELAGSWVFSGGVLGGLPTRYYHFLTPRGGSAGTILSVVCEDTAEACREHMETLHRIGPPPPVPPAPPPPPHLSGQGPAGWLYGPQGFVPARGINRDLDCADCRMVRYPVEPGFEGISGKVILLVTIDERGRVLDVRVEKSSRNRTLDRAAMTQVRQWLFQPGMRDGVAVGGDIRVPVQFIAADSIRGADLEARRSIPVGRLDPATAKARPELVTPARITHPEEARAFLYQACLMTEVEKHHDHRVVLHRGADGHSFWSLFDEHSRLKGAVVRRRLVLDGDKARVKVSYVCSRDGNACELVEQYLERNLRDFTPHLPTVPSQATLGEDRCDPR